MSIRDWKIDSKYDETYIIHDRCPLAYRDMNPKQTQIVGDPVKPSAGKILNTWMCQKCHEAVPEEIVFAASLTGPVIDILEAGKMMTDLANHVRGKMQVKPLFDHKEGLLNPEHFPIVAARPLLLTAAEAARVVKRPHLSKSTYPIVRRLLIDEEAEHYWKNMKRYIVAAEPEVKALPPSGFAVPNSLAPEVISYLSQPGKVIKAPCSIPISIQ